MGKEEVGSGLKYFWVGVGQLMDLHTFFQGSDTGYSFVWIGDLGDDPQDWPEPWGVPPQCGPLHYRDESRRYIAGKYI